MRSKCSILALLNRQTLRGAKVEGPVGPLHGSCRICEHPTQHPLSIENRSVADAFTRGCSPGGVGDASFTSLTRC